MPKYTVSEVLEIIMDLSASEKLELQQELPRVLEIEATPKVEDVPAQSQSIAGLTISDSNSIAFNQNQLGQGSNLTQTDTRATLQNVDMKTALSVLAQLRQDVALNQALSALEKQKADASIETIEEELQKTKPNKNRVNQAMEALKQGLTGIEVLVGPVSKVADLIAKAWTIWG